MQEVEYVPLVELIGSLGGNVWQAEDKLIAILPPRNDAGFEVVLTQGNNRVLVNGRAVMLPVAVRFMDNEIYVPSAFLNELFPVQLSRMPQVLSLSLSHLRDTTVLRVELDTVAYYSSIAVTSTYYRVYFQADCRIKRLDPTGLVRRLDFNQRNGTELLVSTTEPSVCRIVREGRGITVRFTPRARRHINTIVIDPGHGGKDPGALGKRLKEKDVNLDIARRLSKRLKQVTRAEVVLTRDQDQYVSLADRTRLANARQADLYVSIHCNSAPDSPSAAGFETFFLSAARTDWERAVMSRENGALDFAVSDSNPAKAELVGSILRDLAQNEFLKESQELATQVQASTTTWLRGKDRGVKQADFVVLRNAYMPATLVECGFLTNANEERLLGAGDYRERVAIALSNGIMNFVTHLENLARYSEGATSEPPNP
jgi:N-acetylmuramoyl-L-alanine amidase